MASPYKAAGRPRTKCPFSGDDLQIVETGSGFQVRGRGWVSTRFYLTRELAAYDFSFNHGVKPKFPNPLDRIRVGEERLPVLPSSESELAREEKTLDAFSNEVAKEVGVP